MDKTTKLLVSGAISVIIMGGVWQLSKYLIKARTQSISKPTTADMLDVRSRDYLCKRKYESNVDSLTKHKNPYAVSGMEGISELEFEQEIQNLRENNVRCKTGL